ncbi:MAG: transcription antitermination factor NusB [Bacteroidales bacterium]|jgi:N utilization substance protein B
MISRRLLRIKTLMSLYAFNRRDDNNLPNAEKELIFSIEKTYELYHLLFLLLIEIHDIAIDKIEQAKHKNIPTQEDLNPNYRFVENRVLAQLRNNETLGRYAEEKKLSWVNYRHVVRSIYNEMVEWDIYNQYMNAPLNNYQSDKKFIVQMVTKLFPVLDELENSLEEMSIYWNDDMEYVAVMVGKTIRKFKAGDRSIKEFMPLFKSEDDLDFVKILFRKAVLNGGKYLELIDKHTTNWEVERIALMDILVMQMAINEIVEFSDIPVKVTLNEYIEIAKYYCTSKSATFVNGILDNIVKEIKETGMFSKSGRGLVDMSDIK